MTQSDVLVDVPGLPKYGLRYSAPTDQYDPAVWTDLLASLQVGGGPDGPDRGSLPGDVSTSGTTGRASDCSGVTMPRPSIFVSI